MSVVATDMDIVLPFFSNIGLPVVSGKRVALLPVVAIVAGLKGVNFI